jgi:hypothetical protein
MRGVSELATLDRQLAASVPADVAEEIATWQTETGREIILDHWLDLGNTSARVAAVGVRGGGEDARKMILKLCPPDRTTAREPRRHKEALEKSPAAFAADHLVRQPIEPVQLKPSNWWLLFQEIAGGSFRQVRPLFALVDNVELPQAVVQVVESLLNDWNPEKDLRRMSVPEFFAATLGTRIEPDGPILAWAAEVGLAEPQWVVLGDEVVPNPAAVAQAALAADLNVDGGAR